MNTKQVLNQNNFVFKKKFGQNFLLDENILLKIADLGNLNNDTLAIEVGVGAATLTKKISEKSGMVLGYEIDTSLKEPLSTILSDYNNIDIIFDDFLKRDLNDDLKKYNYKKIVVVANLPYYITTPIIEKFIKEKINVSRIIVMVQNEVADRFAATPGTRNYNSLTVFLNYNFNIKKAFVVSRNVFYPRPNVDSAVVVFEKRNKIQSVENEELFFKLVRDSFKQKRKTLKNNLSGYNILNIKESLIKLNKKEDCRAEALSLDDFIFIANNIKAK